MNDPITTGLGLAAAKATPGMIARASNFLGRICNPAADELGLLLKDQVAAMRQHNATRLLLEAKRRSEAQHGDEPVAAPPRLVHKIVDGGAWIDDDFLRDLWAGLLASGCTPSGDDDSNLLFVNLIEDLSGLQARLIGWCCDRAHKLVSSEGLILAAGLSISLDGLKTVTNCSDLQRLDREMDHLRYLGLFASPSGFSAHRPTDVVAVTPTPLALQLWCRCQGTAKSPAEYFGISVDPFNPNAHLSSHDWRHYHDPDGQPSAPPRSFL